MSGTFRGVLLLILLLLGGGTIAKSSSAQQSPDSANAGPGNGASASDDAPRFFVTFGPGGNYVLWPNRWGPITITLTCGAKPFSGSIVIDFTQDGKPGGLVQRPVSCTPGRTTTIPVMVNPGRGCRHVGVTLQDQMGRRVNRKIFDSMASGPDQYALGPLTDTSSVAVMGVGEPTGAARSVTQAISPTRGYSAFGTTQVVTPGDDGSQLVTAWTGYDSLLILSVDAEVFSKVDPRAVAAIREWVSGGGRLVLFVNQPGSAWREWFGTRNDSTDVSEGLFSVDEASGGPVPAELAGEMHKPLRSVITDQERALHNFTPDGSGTAAPNAPAPDPAGPPASANDPDPPAPSNDEEPLEDPAPIYATGETVGPTDVSHPLVMPPEDESEFPAESEKAGPAQVLLPAVSDDLSRRLIRLTDDGIRAGWKARWALDTSESGSGGTTKEGLLAEGPYGFGWVVVVGVDPNLATAIQSPQAICAIWTSIAVNALADWNNQFTAVKAKGPTPIVPDPSLAGPETESAMAKVSVMERLAKVPTLGDGVFYALAAALFGLALLLGPIDAMLLRRLRARQWSWATSLMWIVLASVAAMFIPTMLRSGSTKLNRVSVIDMIASTSADGKRVTAPLAWRTSYTGVYASSTGERAFTSDSPGVWWRSVSAQTYSAYYNANEKKSGRVTASVQMLPDFSSLDPSDQWAGMSMSSDRSDGNRLTPTMFKVWTFRTFTDQARERPIIDAMLTPVEGSTSREWSLRLTGVPEAAKIRNLSVKLASVWHEAKLETQVVDIVPGSASSRTTRNATLVPKTAAGPLDELWAPVTPTYVNPLYPIWNQGYGSKDPAKVPGYLLSLPGPDRRGMVIDRFFANARAGGDGRSREWAVVYLELTNMPCDVKFGDDTEYSHEVVMRILVHVGAAGSDILIPAGNAETNTPGGEADRNGTDTLPAGHDDPGGNP
ncbi:MAG: hypothetical protein H7210_04435 [Pyrinomonadaceae bacterium]|nr:hypothetical protein [Phycisphaerales bacterium]